jgi:hypothetical protein
VKVYRNGARTGGVQRFRSLTPVTRHTYPQVRGKCTAALAAMARAVLGAVLVLAVVASVLRAWAGPQGWPLVAWLLAVCAVVVAAGLCASALQPEGDGGHG